MTNILMEECFIQKRNNLSRKYLHLPRDHQPMKPRDLFIYNQYRKLNDEQLASELGLAVSTIKDIRAKLKIKRTGLTYTDRNKLAKLLVMFFNGKTVAKASAKLDMELRTACENITSHAMYKKKSYNTITLVIESKMNFTEAEINLRENPFLPKEIKF